MDDDALGIAGEPLGDEDAPRIHAGFIGCGSHAFRNIYPALQFAPVRLIATCDLDPERATRFARRFGAARWYTDHHRMLADESLDAVFVVTNYDRDGRPRYPPLAIDAMRAGCHKGLFLLGYAGEVRYFAEHVLTGSPPAVCGLDDAREVMKVYEALLQPPGRVVEIP